MENKKRGGSRFVRGLLIYCLIFLLLAAAVIFVLGLYLRAYEASRSTTCVQNYINSCAAGKLTYGWGSSLAGLDNRLLSEEQSRAFIQEKLAGASYREVRSENSGEKRYALYDADGVCFEHLTLRQQGAASWGFTSWEVVGESCDVSPYTHSYTVTVPSEYRVLLGDTELDVSFLAETGIPYTILEPCGELVHNLPTKVRYETGPCLVDAPITVLNAWGKEVPADKQDEYHYLANCSSEVQGRLEEFSLRYLNAYLPYAGDLYRNGLGFWGDLSKLIVRDGELEQRLIAARKGFGYGNTKSIEIVDHTVNLCTDLKDGHYVVDLLYRTETVGLEGPIQEDNRVRLLIWEENEQLFAEAMYHY